MAACLFPTVPAAAQDLLMADAEWEACEGRFFDSGGAEGQYANSQDLTAVLCPGGGAGSGAATSVEFLSFTVGSFLDPGDALAIHDGTSTAAPLLGTGTYAEPLTGQTFTATGPTGCLTFHWTSGLFGTAAGWEAVLLTGPDAGTAASITLCGDQEAFALFDALNGDPDVGGSWHGPGGPHGPVYDPGTDPGGAYTYTVIDGSLCRDSATVTITNVAPPDPGEDGVLLACNASPPVPLIGILGGTPTPGGTWTGPGGPTDGTFDPATDAPGTYTYSVGGNAPCPNGTATVTVAITDVPDAGNDGALSTCDTVQALDLFSGLGGSPDIGGTWTDLGATGALTGGLLDTQGLAPGAYAFRYQVTVSGCGADDAVVTVHVVGGVQVSGLTRSCGELTGTSIIAFTLSGGDPDSYAVTGIPGAITATVPFRFTSDVLADSLAYTFTVTDAEGCGPVTITSPPCTYPPSVFIPESFSPNADGINDTFEIPGLEDFPGNEMTIFNRWGARLYHTVDYHEEGKAWKGSVDNEGSFDLVPSGTYYYVLELGGGRSGRKGIIYVNGVGR